MSRSRRTRRSRRAQPRERAAPVTESPAHAPTAELQTLASASASASPRQRAVRATYPHVGGELRRVLSVSVASFGLLLLLIIVDRMR